MSQVSIDVEVFCFERSAAGEKFQPVKQKNYKTIINDQHDYELPMVVLEQDDKGNTLRYIACNVSPTAGPIVKAREVEVSKPKRSVVAKSPKNVATPVVETPVVEPVIETPAPVEKPVKRSKRNEKEDPSVQAFRQFLLG